MGAVRREGGVLMEFFGKTWDVVLTCIVVAAAIGVIVCLKL